MKTSELINYKKPFKFYNSHLGNHTLLGLTYSIDVYVYIYFEEYNYVKPNSKACISEW